MTSPAKEAVNSIERLDKDFRKPAAAAKLVFLESARGLAALAVVFYHLTLTFFPRRQFLVNAPPPLSAVAVWQERLFNLMTAVFFNGHLAVRFFFLLSGFVLSLSFLKSGELSTLRSAAIRRYPRLALPVFGTVMIAWMLLATIGPHGRQVASLTGQTPGGWIEQFGDCHPTSAQALYEGAYGAFFDFSNPRAIDPTLWTMSIELFNSFFVFGFLALMAGVHRRGRIYLLLGIVLILIDRPMTVDFLCGVAIADLFYLGSMSRLRDRLAGYGIPLLFCGLILGTLQNRIESLSSQAARWLQQLPTLAATAILMGLLVSGALQHLLSIRTLTFLGRISFGLYLVHQPILASVGCLTYVQAQQHSISASSAALAAMGICLALSLILATLIHFVLELPGIAVGRWLDRVVFSDADQRVAEIGK